MKNKNLLFLSADDIKNVISMKDVIVLMKDAFRQITEGKISAPLRTQIDIPQYEAGALVMPAHSDESELISLKLVTVFNNNPAVNLPLIHALVVLMDGKDGQPLAIMDGEYLTALRTGAASGLATDLLAGKDTSVLGLFGAGVQGRTQVEAVCEVRNIQKVVIFDKDPQAAKSLASVIGKEHQIKTEIDQSGTQLSDCDIICTATSSSTPVFSNADLKRGVHINAIGAYQPDKREIPGETIKRSKLVVDQRLACLSEAGDLAIPIQEKLISEDHIYAELGEIVTGLKSGRSDDTEITLFKSVGNAAQDLLTAGEIYKKALELEIGTTIIL
jgi:alanine dehydrogenase